MATQGLIIAGLSSGSGKTTVTLGLIRALCRQKTDISAAKCGPDYIDCSFLAAASGRQAITLDEFAMPDDMLRNAITSLNTSHDHALFAFDETAAFLSSIRSGSIARDLALAQDGFLKLNRSSDVGSVRSSSHQTTSPCGWRPPIVRAPAG